MNNQFYDIVVAKEYESTHEGQVQKRTAWNRVGRAWISKSSGSLSFELFMLPNQRYVVNFNGKEKISE